MVLAGLGAFVANVVIDDWRHQVLWLELLELTPFAVFWAVQTFEHWDGGVPTGTERDAARRGRHRAGSTSSVNRTNDSWDSGAIIR